MSVNVAWFPYYCHIVAGIFFNIFKIFKIFSEPGFRRWKHSELQLRIYYHRWGGVMGWMKFKISQLGHGLGLGLS